MHAVEPLPGSARRAGLAALACALVTAFWIATLDVRRAWGWDEAMHAELPAARLLLAARAGDGEAFWTALHACQQYPFGWPLVLALVQAVTGLSETAARVAGLVAWGGTLFGVYALGVEVGRAQRRDGGGPRPGEDLLPWLALALAALSPLALGYAQSLFLEVPSALVSAWALVAWLRRGNRRGEPGSRGRELLAGALLTAAFFTKFNYGTLLIAACGLDALLELLVARRAGRLGPELRALGWLATPVALGLGWWFLLPLPLGPGVAAEHRRVFLEFLAGNLGMATTPWQRRVVFWTVMFAPTARLFLLELVGVLAALPALRRAGGRLLGCAALVTGLPVWLHTFQLDRFLIPAGPALWTLAALGLAPLLPLTPRRRGLVLAGLAALTLLWPQADGPWVGRRLGLVPEAEPGRTYVEEQLAGYHRLGAGRRTWTPGIERAAARELLDLAVGAVGPGEAVGWIGNPTEVPPAALHLALLEASGDEARFLRDAHRPVDVSFNHIDPGWSDAELGAFVERFDVVLSTDPPDLAGRAERAFVRGYATRLVGALGWRAELLGRVAIPRESRPDLEVALYALRPPGP
jgi:hypothetical protein